MLIGFGSSQDFAYNNIDKPTLNSPTFINYTQVNVNNSDYWDNLDTPLDISGSQFWYNETLGIITDFLSNHPHQDVTTTASPRFDKLGVGQDADATVPLSVYDITSNIMLDLEVGDAGKNQIRFTNQAPQIWVAGIDAGEEFVIGDNTAGTTPFTIVEGTGTNAFYLDSTGLGLGAVAGANLDIVDGTPVMRLVGTNSKLRFVASSAGNVNYIQAGNNVVDENAILTFSRTNSGTTNINKFNVYANTTYFSGNVGRGTTTPKAPFNSIGAIRYDKYTNALGAVATLDEGSGTANPALKMYRYTGTPTKHYPFWLETNAVHPYARVDFKFGTNAVIGAESVSTVMSLSPTLLNVSTNTNIKGNLAVTGNITGNNYYGGMWYHNHTGTTLPFTDADTWYPLYYTVATDLNGFTYVGGFGESSNLTALVNGKYQASYMGIGSGQNNHIYLTTVLINGVEKPECGNHHKMAAGGDVITQSGVCIITINAGDTIQVATQDMGGTGDGLYYGGNLNLVRIGD